MTDVQEGRGAVLRRALRNRRLRRALVAYLVFNVHESAVYVALLVWAYADGGVAAASVLGLLQLVPSALLASPLAAWLQRLDRAPALLLGYALQTLTLLLLAAVLFLDVPFAVVAIAAALAAVAVTMTRPAHHAFLPEISETAGDLTAGNATSGSVEAVAIFLGPLLSGLLLAAWEPGGVMLVMGVACGAAWALLVPGTPRRARGSRGARVADGAAAAPTGAPSRGAGRAVRQHPAARLLCGLVAAAYVLVGMLDILLVVLALDLLAMSQAGPGILTSALGAGGLVGAALTLLLIGRARLAPAVVIGAVVAGVPLAVAGLATYPVVAIALVAVSGAGKLFFEVANRTFVQRLLPDRLLTAVFGVQESLMMAGLALGTLLAPLLVSLAGASGAFVIAGAFLPCIALLSVAGLRRLDRQAVVPADVVALLRAVPFLSVLAPRVLERLALESTSEHRAADTDLVVEGTTGDRFYVVVSGRASVTLGGKHVRELGSGGWFGELALLRDGTRTATVRSVTDVELRVLGRDAFLAAVGLHAGSLAAAGDHARDHYR